MGTHYTFTHGKGVMGPHQSLLTKYERWEIVHYILALRNGGTSPYKAGAAPADTTGNN